MGDIGGGFLFDRLGRQGLRLSTISRIFRPSVWRPCRKVRRRRSGSKGRHHPARTSAKPNAADLSDQANMSAPPMQFDKTADQQGLVGADIAGQQGNGLTYWQAKTPSSSWPDGGWPK
ncbi:MAG: hypothetical protein Q4G22_09695 [Paracoccus sp. (in: a-proteobacteria)]|uniref:hypothetical protein n=1 Tax=Paracoccus sp. TaxID=267 RepID=UPI0026DFBFDC|nr:hypothetical protein [Paracoccus sp. (in: a-proteobacteria)]MDO5632100.1 hypothetical protein [Paracoccus sp. (in: a-proteobacteria)]